jgi:hypothetical protein
VLADLTRPFSLGSNPNIVRERLGSAVKDVEFTGRGDVIPHVPQNGGKHNSEQPHDGGGVVAVNRAQEHGDTLLTML